MCVYGFGLFVYVIHSLLFLCRMSSSVRAGAANVRAAAERTYGGVPVCLRPYWVALLV